MNPLLLIFFICLFGPLLAFKFPDVVDLSWDFDNETLYWSGIKNFSFTKVIAGDAERGYWYSMKEFCAGEHGGTHFDAPYHFNKKGWKVGDVPTRRLIAKGAYLQSNYTLIPEQLELWEKLNGHFENNTILLLSFGWSSRWPNKTEYFALDSRGIFNFPGVSRAAAEWIVENGKIVGVGVDTPSVDPGITTDFHAHRILNGNQIYILENVKHKEPLPVRDFTVVVSPMKIREGSGAPVRIFALLKRDFASNEL